MHLAGKGCSEAGVLRRTMHPLSKLDAFFNIEEGVTRSVIVLHDTQNLEVLRAKLADHGITLKDDTSIPKGDRVKWAFLANRAGLPRNWWMVDDEPEDFIPTL